MSESTRRRVGVFAKHWTPGRTKTRLAAAIGPEAAADAARRFVEVTTQRVGGLHADRVLAATPAELARQFESLEAVRTRDWRIAIQPDAASLGDRMRWFFEAARDDGFASAVLLGADSPDLPLEAIERAFDYLERGGEPQRMVFGPSADGGYWLIGGRGDAGPVFDNLPWSTDRLLDTTLGRLREHGWRRGREYELVDAWYDIDTAADLAACCQRIEADGATDPSLRRLAVEGRRWLSVV